MADYIQSRVEIIHSTSEGKPTSTPKDTQATASDESSSKAGGASEGKQKGKILRHLGRGAVYRRLANLALNTIENQQDLKHNKLMFEQSMKGDRMGMVKLQNRQAEYKAYSSMTKGLVIASISARVMKNPVIVGIWAVSEGVDKFQQYQQVTERQRQQRERERVEMFVSDKRNERLRVGTYDRR